MMDKETFDSLAIHLKEMHSDLTAQDVLEIVAGVAASPIDEGTIGDQDGWISLIAEKPDISLTACLKQQLGSALDEPNGLKSSGYETLTLFYISVIDVLNSGFRILFYCVIGSVVLSWVAPGKNNLG